MSSKRWRLRTLVPVGLTTAVGLALAIAWRAPLRVLQTQASQADAARALAEAANAYLLASLIVLLVTAVIGVTLGNALARRVDQLRRDTLRLVRSGASTRMPRSSIAEIHALSSAAEFLVGEFAERAVGLARDRDELAVLVNQVSEGILQVDDRARIVRANPAARALLNLPEDVRGQSIASLVRNAELRELLSRIARGEFVRAAEIALDDRRILVVGRSFNESGPAGAVAAIVDLTELRRLEGVRRDFVANVSHELKTPLTSIRGYVETLLTDTLSPGMQQQFLDVVQKNAERLHHIVEDLLDLSRLESGGWRPEPHPVNPAEIARDVWNGLLSRPGASPLTFEVTGASVPAIADPGGLRQVLANLFDNAIRHTPAGGTVTVRISSEASRVTSVNEWTVIEVKDTGAGIPRDALGRIFERFYRVDPARSRAEGGTGLGLSIVRHLVERMGGDVGAESELGKGTTIRVRLPAPAAPRIVQQSAG